MQSQHLIIWVFVEASIPNLQEGVSLILSSTGTAARLLILFILLLFITEIDIGVWIYDWTFASGNHWAAHFTLANSVHIVR